MYPSCEYGVVLPDWEIRAVMGHYVMGRPGRENGYCVPILCQGAPGDGMLVSSLSRNGIPCASFDPLMISQDAWTRRHSMSTYYISPPTQHLLSASASKDPRD